ncbi:hypothetical protein SRHO_G00215610 [Serrasalmus rhombeus]
MTLDRTNQHSRLSPRRHAATVVASSTHSSITHSGLCGTFAAKVCLRLGAHTWISHSKVAHSLEKFWSSFQSAFGLLLKEEEAPIYEAGSRYLPSSFHVELVRLWWHTKTPRQWWLF